MHPGDWSLLLLIGSWIVRVVMIPVVVTRKEQPATCLAWLMIVFFQPWIGLGLYFLIGEDRLVRRRLKWREQAGRTVDAGHPEVESSDTVAPGDLGELSTLALLGQRAGGLPVVSGNCMELEYETDAFIARLIDDIDAATDHVHLLFYIFEDDTVGQRVGEALVRAAGRGVECRLLADAVGSRLFFRSLAAEIARSGVEIAACLPVGLMRRRMARIDMRNHRKLAVIDGRIAWTGSQNIVEDTYGHRRAGRWQDVMARVTGPVVRQFQITFLEDWYFDTRELLAGPRYFPQNTPVGSTTLQVVPSGPDQSTESFQFLIVEAIHSARHSVTITSPYLVPDEALMCALQLAAVRGVEVVVIIPRRSDHIIVDAASSFYIGRLLQSGVQFFRFHEGLLHAKTLTVDDSFGLFGSANFDIRSFHLNFEINVSLFDRQAVQELKSIQDGYRDRASGVTLEEWHLRPAWKRLGGNVAKLFSPLM